MITPFAAAAPYAAADEASFKTCKDSISFGFRSVIEPTLAPSTTYKGSFELKVVKPLILMEAPAPGTPDVPTVTPDALPCSKLSTFDPGLATSSLALTTDTEPVISFLR